MSSWHSYPKIYNLGHAALKELLNGEVLIEEKVDGSQFSFGRFGDEIRVRSKGVEMRVDSPEKMFSKAVDWVKMNAHCLKDGWTYRAEYLQKPKHNTLCYDRVPQNFLIIFDINTGEEAYMNPDVKRAEAERLGLECVPVLFHGDASVLGGVETIQKMLERVSVLGGAKIEGVVIKNYSKFGPDKKALMGKHVSEAFKEAHSGDWRERNPTSGDVMVLLADKYRTPARWQKAIQHLRDDGKLENSPRDIGNLIAEVKRDVLAECGEEIKEALFKFAWPKIQGSLIKGLPEWYKNKLLEAQFVPLVESQFDAADSAVPQNSN